MSDVAQLLIPSLRADADGRFTAARDEALAALGAGVGGFVLHGGDQDAVRALTKELQQRSRVPLLIGAELERGAGQQFVGATGLPPLAALAALGDAEALRRAARHTAREARTMGVNWNLAPVVDLDDDGASSGTRSLGADAPTVSRLAAEWITACQAEGVLACAKHFPGRGRAPRVGGGGEVPVVRAGRDELHATDLAPFRAAIDANVASMMTAHVAYPALDPSALPATTSRELLQWLLRQQLRYDNLIVGDAAALRESDGSEADAIVHAIGAGCDVVLAPAALREAVDALDAGVRERRLDPDRVRQSVRRRLKWAQWAAPPNDWRRPTASDAAWGAQLCDRVVTPRGDDVRALAERVARDRAVDVRLVGGGDADGTRADGTPVEVHGVDAFAETLRTAGIAPRHPSSSDGGGERRVVALCVTVPGPDAASSQLDALASRVAADCEAAARRGDAVLAVLFAHPRLASLVPPAVPTVCAWTADPAMQRAAARWIASAR